MSNQSDLAKSAAGFNGDPLSIDTANNRVGIGTSSPSTNLDVTGTSRYTFNVDNAYTLQTSLNAAGSSFADDYKNASTHIWQTSGTERMRIDSAGRVTMPYQPFFRGNLTAHVSPNTAVSAPGNTITSFNVQENVGNHWNNTTSTWTCPVAGKYMVSAYMIKYPVAGASHVDLYKNGTYVDVRIRPEETATYTQASGMIYITCAANDTLQWKYFGSAGVHSYNGAWTIGLVG